MYDLEQYVSKYGFLCARIDKIGVCSSVFFRIFVNN